MTMDDWKKVPPELATRFLAALPGQADVERRQMFGCPCAFVNGNMFAGLHEDRLIVRLPDEAAQRPCVIMGRTMKQYALFADARKLTPKTMAQWIQRGYAFTQALPAKVKKAPKVAKPAAPAKVAKPSPMVKAMKAQAPKVAAKAAAKVEPTARKSPAKSAAKSAAKG
jgi:TfoX/Sxy family transcriptional regulator of competence genes